MCHPTGNSAPVSTHYTVLEINNSSSDVDIRKAYRKENDPVRKSVYYSKAYASTTMVMKISK